MTDKVRPFKPMSAAKAKTDAEWAKVTWPKIAQPKLDGIRCVIKDGQALSRRMKPIPNKFIQSIMSEFPEGLDGEIVTLTDGVPDEFNTSQSKIMNREGEPEFKFIVFDCFLNPEDDYVVRTLLTENLVKDTDSDYLELITDSVLVDNYEDAVKRMNELIDAGYEGAMLRDMKGPYKFGGSTLKAGLLIKMKRFVDDEATIVGFEEEMANMNEATKDAFGNTERSGHKDGKVPKGTLGAFICEWSKGPSFKIGTGFDAGQRKDYWERREELKGKTLTFKYQEIGSNGRPRFPTFIGLRPEYD